MSLNDCILRGQKEASDPQPVEIDADSESFRWVFFSRPQTVISSSIFIRAALESSTLNYILAHFHDGVASVFSVARTSKFFIQIVANKYNPSNYWCVRVSVDVITYVSTDL
jgi:capping protein alpha